MTSEKTGTMVADVEYMRNLAEAGQSAPLLGGRFSVLWGVLVSIATLSEWLILSHRVGVGADKIGLIWLATGLIGGAISVVLGRSLRGKPGFGSIGNRASQIVWSAGGGAIVVYVMGVVAAVVTGKGVAGDFDTIMPMAFCIYGVAYLTTAAMSGIGFMKAAAGLSFVAALVTGALIHQPVVYLVATVFVFLTAVVPGLVMMRAEPPTVV